MERLRANDLVGGKCYRLVVPGDDAPGEMSAKFLGFFGYDDAMPAAFLYAQPEGKILGCWSTRTLSTTAKLTYSTRNPGSPNEKSP